jgi:hypothetical protein
MISDISNQQDDILTDVVEQLTKVRRKYLLPWWIKAFMWFFLIFGVLAVIGVVLGIMGYRYEISLYGLTSDNPLSTTGICITLLFLLKGITSFGLLKEENWAIKLGIIDAVVGIVLCVLIMIFPTYIGGPDAKFSFRLELILLVLYLNKLLKVQHAWENNIQA